MRQSTGSLFVRYILPFVYVWDDVYSLHYCQWLVAIKLDPWCLSLVWIIHVTLQWRHNVRDGVSYHQPHDCLLNRLFQCRSKKTSKLRVTGLCAGNSPGPVKSLHKGPVTRKMFPFDDVIMGMRCMPVTCSMPKPYNGKFHHVGTSRRF